MVFFRLGMKPTRFGEGIRNVNSYCVYYSFEPTGVEEDKNETHTILYFPAIYKIIFAFCSVDGMEAIFQ